jgi:histone deacetylase 6
MDPSISSTLLESSMPDIIMRENSNTDAVNNNSNLQNGFVDPRVLEPPNAPDFPESSPEDSMQESERLPDDSRVLGERLFWKLSTACCYDDRMKLHANTDWSESQHHPEDPRRIEAIMKAFRDAGLIFTGNDDELAKELKKSPTQWMWRIRAREATQEEICLAHTASHYAWTEMLSKKSSAELREMSKLLDQGRKSLYVNSLTFHAALISAGGAIETCKNVVAGYVKNAIAVIRPPGHHAEHNESLGFCIFNNVPIAAKVCMQDYPEKCRKVLILDWDVHHGNGIQNMFYDDPNVLYISLHVYQDGSFYPGQPSVEGIPDGGLRNVGDGPGVGRNINIGWHDQGMGDAEYISAFQQIIMPIAREFDPDLVIISAGFDAAAGDELGGCFVSPECYSHMTHMLMSLADGKVAVCLEGGYNLSAISRSALAVAKTLMGEPPMRMKLAPINKQATLVLSQVKQIHAAYWECMRIGVVPVHEVQQRGGVRMNDVLRAYQRHILLKYRMVPLYVQREKTSRAFKDQILITPLIHAAKKILLIIHDP